MCGYIFNKKSGSDVISSQYLDVDSDFLKTFDVKMKEGRFFSEYSVTDSSAVVINEAAARECGTGNLIGKELTRISINEAKTFRIIGVVNDFNYESLHQNIRPLVFHLSPVRQAASVLYIRVNSNNLTSTINYMKQTWQNFTDEERCNYVFVNQYLERLYSDEEKTGVIILVFSFLAIVIACLGLFGLAAFVTEQRIKEIGIRKVLGASVMEIVVLLSKEFTKWVILANIIAWPAAYYVLQKWLSDFAFRIDIGWYVFVLSGIVALSIALITVSIQAVKAALSNPVISLKCE